MKTVQSAVVWASIWGTAGFLFGYHGLEKGDSWVIRIPLCMLVSVAVWGTIRGVLHGQVPGAVIGTLLGYALGIVGMILFVFTRPLVNERAFLGSWGVGRAIAWGTAGVTAGALVGAVFVWVESAMVRTDEEVADRFPN